MPNVVKLSDAKVEKKVEKKEETKKIIKRKMNMFLTVSL